MSRENVEIVRALIDAFNRGDWETMFKDMAPSFEYDASRAVGPWHGVYRGLDEMRRVVEEFAEPWESIRLEGHELIEAGEHVVVPWTMKGTGRGGVAVEARTTWVWTIRNGSILRAVMYQERAEALEAAGLSE